MRPQENRKNPQRIFSCTPHSYSMAGQSTLWVGTARMLRRAGFGVTGPEVDAAVARGWPGHLDAMLAADPDADPGALATP
ncbi:hypothetical protein BST46_21910, partial [Mycobacterium timonense]